MFGSYYERCDPRSLQPHLCTCFYIRHGFQHYLYCCVCCFQEKNGRKLCKPFCIQHKHAQKGLAPMLMGFGKKNCICTQMMSCHERISKYFNMIEWPKFQQFMMCKKRSSFAVANSFFFQKNIAMLTDLIDIARMNLTCFVLWCKCFLKNTRV